MIKLVLILAAVFVSEIASLWCSGQSQPGQLDWHDVFVTTNAVLMCWGGVEAARWLLRRSPAAKLAGPRSDWTRLWLWVGAPGGILFCLGLLAAWALSHFSPGKVPMLLTYQVVVGGLAWLIGAFWAMRDLHTANLLRGFNLKLAVAGLLGNALGMSIYLWGFPGILGPFWRSELLVLGSTLFVGYYYVFFYVLFAVVAWSVAFTFWQPEQQDS